MSARPSKTHDLRIWADSFHAISLGLKKAEVRRCDDRDFRRGDKLMFREYTAGVGVYTGRAILVKVTHIVRWAGELELHGQAQAEPGAAGPPCAVPIVVMSFDVLEIDQHDNISPMSPGPEKPTVK